jgi:nucleolar GTP-binding protein
MLLQNVGKIESAKFYVDNSIRVAIEQARKLKKDMTKDRLVREKRFETAQINACQRNLSKRLSSMVESFPRFERLPEFYYELAKITLDLEGTKDALRRVDLFMRESRELAKHYSERIQKCTDREYVEKSKKAFYGRLHSSAKKTEKQMLVLEKARRIMRGYPAVKTSLPTVVIIGFPNVGKTTLLYHLTGSRPEIKNYAFTTKDLNVGYLDVDGKEVQLLDTPGTLNRFEKMNTMEKQAYLAVKLLACCIIYVFDLTESYSLDEQIRLYHKLGEMNKPIIVYASKTDLSADKMDRIAQYSPITNPRELVQRMIEILK